METIINKYIRISNFIECSKKIFNEEENISKVLKDQIHLSAIIENIRFFIHKVNRERYLDFNSLRIYEYGLFMKDENKSVSLLLYYANLIVNSVHEICCFLFLNNKNFSSNNLKNNLKENEKNFNYDYIKQRKKEFDVTLEKLLFGKRMIQITIKEALFIIDTHNYIFGLNNFTQNFKKCNNIQIENIIHPNIKPILSDLDIHLNQLPNDSKKLYIINHYVYPHDSEIKFEESPFHSPGFYFGRLKTKGFDEMLTYIDLIQKDIQEENQKNK